LFFFILCTPYVASFSGLSFCLRNWQHRGYTRWRKTKRQSRGKIGGTQDEEKQNDNPEETWGVHKMKKKFLWIVVLFFSILCTSYVASFSGLSFCFSSSCVPPMFPLDCRFVFLHLVYPQRQSRETGNIGGTQDEEKKNDNPEAT
jgi:hypothetical protein